MNPDTRMAISLLLSLAVSAPNLRLAAGGGADIVTVGVRYVVAFLVAFVTVGAVGRVFADYVHGRAAEADGSPPADTSPSDLHRPEAANPLAAGPDAA